ncbi:MAG: D-alanine--D-alanine ligase [Clostridiaceae bacterium]
MKVGVILGGISSEREVSLNSGKEVFKYYDKEKYDVQEILIDKKEDVFTKAKDIDFAFIVLHGKFGEDGIIQAVFEAMDIPYSGCGPLTSGICMDKDITKRLLRSNGINTADWLSVKSIEEIDYGYIEKMGYPVVVKPNSGGSSVATNIIKRKEDIEEAVELAFNYDKEVMIEKYLQGDEITCCILDGKLISVISIKPHAEFFDYTAKYSDGGTDEVIVELEENLQKQVEEMAKGCWDVLKCQVYVRVDMIVQDGVPYVLELNTLPGMTKNSLFPKGAQGAGISFTELLDIITETSLKVKR